MRIAMHDERKAEAIRRRALIEAGKFESALDALGTSIRANPEDSSLFRERAHLNLYLGAAQQSRADFDTVARLESAVFPPRLGWLHSACAYNSIGVTYWIENHRELALSFWRFSTRKLATNRVAYTLGGQGGAE